LLIKNWTSCIQNRNKWKLYVEEKKKKKKRKKRRKKKKNVHFVG